MMILPDQPDQSDEKPEETKTTGMPFLAHLEELRRRLIRSFLFIILFSALAFIFSDELLHYIQLPLAGVPLHNMQVTGAFYAYLKISMFTGVVVSLPFLFYQAWGFVSPGLYTREKVMIMPLVFFSTLLFLIGAGFCFFGVLPVALTFLIGFAGEELTNYITINSYISFAGLLMLAFGFGFQMPIAAYFLGKFGIISSSFLAKGRRYALIIILVAAAIITPPDPLTQIMLAAPMYVLYEISIIVVRITGRKR